MSLDVSLRATVTEEREVYAHSGMTHNMVKMAEWAGVYLACWYPEEIDVRIAADLVPLLKAGLYRLENKSEEAMRFNPSNGWGNYEGFVEFLREYLAACIKYPGAKIEVNT